MDGSEIELKLGLDPEGMALLRRHRLLREHRQGRSTAARLRSVYYDTPDLRLAAEKISLRVRAVGRRHVQTVKTSGSRQSGLFVRREWEGAVPGPQPDPVLLRATGLPVFQDPEVMASLVPAFATDVRRTLYRLGDGSWEVELALDEGEVGGEAGREEICEAEFELKLGEPVRLYHLARSVAETVPVRLMTQSKSERGYALAAGIPPRAVKARPVPLDAGMTVAEAFQAIGRSCVAHLMSNERSLLLARDPEAIHQMRVALRRLRSALKVFRPVVEGAGLQEVRADLRWLLEHLGPARDSHVFLDEIVDPVVARFPGNAPLAQLREDWRQRREEHMDQAIAAVRDRRFSAMVLAIAAWIEGGDWRSAGKPLLSEPVEPFARKVLAKRDKRVRKAGAAGLHDLPAEALHDLRILGKQLRYAGEFFAALYPRKAGKAFASALADLQEVLGQINDIAVAAERLSGARDGPCAWASGLVAGWHEARRADLLEEADRAWRAYRREDRFWQVEDGD